MVSRITNPCGCRTSHEGFQTWSGWGDKSESAGHIVGDGLSGDSRTRTRDAALELRAYYSIFLTRSEQ